MMTSSMIARAPCSQEALKVEMEASQDDIFDVKVTTEEPPKETLLPDVIKIMWVGVMDLHVAGGRKHFCTE